PFSEDGTGQAWYQTIQPYVKNGTKANDDPSTDFVWGGGVFQCSSWPDPPDGADHQSGYGVNDMMPGNFGRTQECPPADGNGCKRPPVGVAEIQEPADKMMIGEKGRNGGSYTAGNGQRVNWGYPDIMALQGFWTGSVLTNGNYDPSKDGSLGTYDPNAQPVVRDRDSPDGDTRWEGGRSLRYRHSGNTNVAFADGHVKSFAKGKLKWYQNVYIPGVYERRKEEFGWYPTAPY
ncbi:MAG: hypothetical protein H7Z41_14265, partial [Cytophagales bacterium]|nr:hypothetical protein [Armatimonadota bacterium]